jgi:hypothetical protein
MSNRPKINFNQIAATSDFTKMEIDSSDDDCQIISVITAVKPSIPVEVEVVKVEKTPLKSTRNFMINLAPTSQTKPAVAKHMPFPVNVSDLPPIPLEMPLENEFSHEVKSWQSSLDSDLAEEILENLKPDHVLDQEMQKIEDKLILKNGSNGTPKGLSKDCRLYDHQIKGLSWMIHMENTLGKLTINPRRWNLSR